MNRLFNFETSFMFCQSGIDRMKKIFILSFIVLSISLSGQNTMHDFTVTDIDGQMHRLYENYLNQGKVVAIKFFFSTCPPCNQAAPQWRQKHTQWASQDVSFFTVTTITSDYDTQVNGFRNNHNLAMACISHDGGAASITNPFKTGNYGSWFGTPSYVVIAPNRRVFYPVFMSNFDATIQMAKNLNAAPTTTINFQPQTQNFQLNTDHVKFYFHSKGNSNSKVEITKNAQGQYKFEYPSSTFPKVNEPMITMESIGPAFTRELTSTDIITIRRHILETEKFEHDYQLLAADTNGDGRITSTDMLQLRNVILEVINEFPNGTPSYKMLPESIEIFENPGQSINLDFQVVKIGNVR